MKELQKHIIVGITGGIGSGKTTISKYFEGFGIPVYYADLEAKALMNRSKVIKRKLIALFGDDAYINNTLNRDYLRSQIFKEKKLLSKMNAIVHPKVGAHFKRWVKKQNAPKSENIKPYTPKVKKPVMQEIKKEAKVKKEIPTRASNDPRDKT